MKPTLVVMAAGIGSRYGGLKQIDPVGPHGEIVVDYSVYDAIRAGFEKVVFVIRKEIEEDFRKIADAHYTGHIEVAYAFQELDRLPAGFQVPGERTKPWGTGHAILCCRDLVSEPFAVINADDFYGRDSVRVLADHLRSVNPVDPRYALVGFTLRNTLSDHGSVARAICTLDEQRRLVGIVERLRIERAGDGARYEAGGTWHPLSGDEPASMNMFGFTPTLFDHLEKGFRAFLRASGTDLKKEYLIPTVVGNLIASGEASVDVLSTDERWLGVTYPQDKPAVAAGIRAQIDAGRYPERLWPAPATGQP